MAGAKRCDGLEFDVRFSREGVAVVVHDATLQRLFGVPQEVRALTVADLQHLGVPTLAAVLSEVPRATLLDVELKEVPTGAFFETAEAHRGRDGDGLVISSFDSDALRAVQRLAPAWSRWLNAETFEEAAAATALEVSGIAVAMEMLSDEALDTWHATGLEVAAWTLKGAEGASWAGDARLVAICAEGAGITAARAVTT